MLIVPIAWFDPGNCKSKDVTPGSQHVVANLDSEELFITCQNLHQALWEFAYSL